MPKQYPNEEFDAIIVGSGPCGSAIARQLTRRQKKVLILERGKAKPLKDSVLSLASMVDDVSVSDKLSTTRAFTTGGTSVVYFGVADLPPVSTFQSLGLDLSAALKEAEKELPLTVLPDHLLGAQSIRVCESARDLGYPWKKNLMLIDLAKCSSGYNPMARWNARSYLDDAVADGATLVTQATVRKVLVDNNKAIGVEYQLQQNGKKSRETCHAVGGRIVISAGSTASPGILRDSGLRSIGNDGFYCHPSFALFGMVPGLKAGQSFIGCMGAELEHDIGLGDANIARGLYRLGMLGSGRVIRAFRHSKSIGVGVTVREGLGGKLRDDGGYHKDLQKEDIAKLEKAEDMARRVIKNAGGKNIFKTQMGSAHVGGMIRIGKDVDQNLETECTHLYVCDGSVIPETVKVSPTLTLICLGKHLAERLLSTL